MLRPALVLLLAFLIFGTVILAYQAIRTLQQLNAVEAERDRWQRADEIIQQLELKPGTTVVDFGSGAGYFALKLSNTVGSNGEVLAVDLRRLSLSFLRARSMLRWQRNLVAYHRSQAVARGLPSGIHNRILTVSLCTLYGLSSRISPTILAQFSVTTACR